MSSLPVWRDGRRAVRKRYGRHRRPNPPARCPAGRRRVRRGPEEGRDPDLETQPHQEVGMSVEMNRNQEARESAIVRDRSTLELSVVMPCLNEADTLATCIEKAQRAMREHGIA